jgi:photosystem II stability/assembly factor-like uncharacterized protein
MTDNGRRGVVAILLMCGYFTQQRTVSVRWEAGGLAHTSFQHSVLDDNPPPNLIDIQFLNRKVGWLAGRIGLFATKDGGETWAQLGPAIAVSENVSPFVLKILTPIFRVSFINEKIGWAQRSDGILRTTDSGQTWDLVIGWEQPQRQALNSISFYDERNGWALKEGAVYHSSDGGGSWVRQTGFAEGRVVRASSGSECWVVGDKGKILRTSDGGGTWVPSLVSTNEDLLDIAVSNAKSIWVVSSNAIYHSDDSGRTWKLSLRDTSNRSGFRSIAFATADTGWVVGNKGTILHTNDGGNTWLSQKSRVKADLKRISVVDPFVVWIVGDALLLRSLDGGKNWLRQNLPKS